MSRITLLLAVAAAVVVLLTAGSANADTYDFANLTPANGSF